MHWLVQLPAWASASILLGPLLLLTALCAARRACEPGAYSSIEPMNKSVEHWVRLAGSTVTILMGFVFVQMWSSYRDADRAVSREANVISSLAFYAKSLPMAQREEAHADLRAYVAKVLEGEWPQMRQGHADAVADPELRRIESLYASMRVKEPWAVEAYSQSLGLVPELRQLHADRLHKADGSIPSFMYGLLVFGVVVLLMWAVAFRGAGRAAHVVGTTMAVALPASVLFAIVLLDFPFAGSLSVTESPFRRAQALLEAEPSALSTPSLAR
ncbi:MAG: hypothetical protein ACO1SV_24950 [Fimbriimonas sp.]